MKELLTRLGQRIRQLRSERGLSQEEFADLCGVHRTYMGHLERGEKNVSFGSSLRIANALGISLSELFTGIESGEQQPGRAQGKKGKTQAIPPAPASLSRERLLSEVASLEKGLDRLRKLAVGAEEPTDPV